MKGLKLVKREPEPAGAAVLAAEITKLRAEGAAAYVERDRLAAERTTAASWSDARGIGERIERLNWEISHAAARGRTPPSSVRRWFITGRSSERLIRNYERR